MLHLWWARRPLAACRAVPFTQLVDDPSAWPEEFPTEGAQDRERARLHKIVAEMVPWEASGDERHGPGALARRGAAGVRPVLRRRVDPAGGAAV